MAGSVELNMKSGFNVNTDTKMLTIGNSMGYGKINLQRFISSTEVRQNYSPY